MLLTCDPAAAAHAAAGQLSRTRPQRESSGKKKISVGLRDAGEVGAAGDKGLGGGTGRLCLPRLREGRGRGSCRGSRLNYLEQQLSISFVMAGGQREAESLGGGDTHSVAQLRDQHTKVEERGAADE